MVRFARGESRKTLTVRPIPDLESEGAEKWQIEVLPQHRYIVLGDAVEQTVQDVPNVHLEIDQAYALPSNPARLRIHRDGALSDSLQVDLVWSGTADEGIHVNALPTSFTIPAGEEVGEVVIEAIPGGLSIGAKVAMVQLMSSELIQLGNPHEAIIHLATSADEANRAGFDHWLTESTSFNSLAELQQSAPEALRGHLMAYAMDGKVGPRQVSFRMVEDRPELAVKGVATKADVRWGVEVSEGLKQWSDAGDAFVEVSDGEGLRLIGPSIAPGDISKFYRLNVLLESTSLAGPQLAAVTGASRYGISGNANWYADQGTGDLKTSGSGPGDTSLLIAEVTGPTTLHFEMSISESQEDTFTFYIDGKSITQTLGDSVTVEHEFSDPEPHLLMWEFKRDAGQAVIRKL